MAKKYTQKAEQRYGCTIVGFVSGSEAKMVKLRQDLAEWRVLMVYGCSAHALNHVQSTATPKAILAAIVAVAKFFCEQHKPAALLKEAGGRIPQLPNSTRWASQHECLNMFISNYELYGAIIDNGNVSILLRSQITI